MLADEAVAHQCHRPVSDRELDEGVVQAGQHAARLAPEEGIEEAGVLLLLAMVQRKARQAVAVELVATRGRQPLGWHRDHVGGQRGLGYAGGDLGGRDPDRVAQERTLLGRFQYEGWKKNGSLTV